MTKQQIINAANRILEQMCRVKKWVPRDTGNLADNAIQFNVYYNGGLIDISVNPYIAPYMPYTNEPWLSPKWNGKKNPNEGWWDRFAAEFARRLARKLKGEMK